MHDRFTLKRYPVVSVDFINDEIKELSTIKENVSAKCTAEYLGGCRK